MSGRMEGVRKWYGVPAKRGGRIAYSGGDGRVLGTIRSARNCRLNVQFDGERHISTLHPTFLVEYLTANGEVT
jgi:hypothetical protein